MIKKPTQRSLEAPYNLSSRKSLAIALELQYHESSVQTVFSRPKPREKITKLDQTKSK